MQRVQQPNICHPHRYNLLNTRFDSFLSQNHQFDKLKANFRALRVFRVRKHRNSPNLKQYYSNIHSATQPARRHQNSQELDKLALISSDLQIISAQFEADVYAPSRIVTLSCSLMMSIYPMFLLSIHRKPTDNQHSLRNRKICTSVDSQVCRQYRLHNLPVELHVSPAST